MEIPFKIDLEGKVAVVTGGSGVLGSVWVDALLQCGARVAVIGRNKEKLEAMAEEAESKDQVILPLVADVLDSARIREARLEINEKLGPCDILINGAGGNHPKGTTSKEYLYEEDLVDGDEELRTFFNLDEEAIQDVFDLNFLGSLIPTKEFVRDMVGREGCSIVNISSMNAYTPLTKTPAYAAAKAGISNFTQWLAVHLSKLNIRVNALAPGFFLTSQNMDMHLNEDGSYTERAKKVVASTPMDRFGKPEELVGPLLFLLDDKGSSFLTGVVIPVDGGYSSYSGV